MHFSGVGELAYMEKHEDVATQEATHSPEKWQNIHTDSMCVDIRSTLPICGSGNKPWLLTQLQLLCVFPLPSIYSTTSLPHQFWVLLLYVSSLLWSTVLRLLGRRKQTYILA